MGVPWFERWPELAEWELNRFAAHGLPASVDPDARALGQFVVQTRIYFRGSEVEVRAVYPSETPELPPVIYGPPGLLSRHQHAFEGNFCLLERPLDDWPAASWGAADLIVDRLTALLHDSSRGPDFLRLAEAPIPEPFTAYYDYAVGPVVLIPGNLVKPKGNSGKLLLRPIDPNSYRFVAYESEGSQDTHPIYDVLPSSNRQIEARWVRLDTPPAAANGPAMLEWIRTHHPSLIRAPLPAKLRGSRHLKAPDVEIVGLVFPEEGPEVGEFRDAWVFLCVTSRSQPFLIHHQVVSVEERRRRIPELASLENSKIVVAGLGTLGGYIAVEFAKAGIGELALVDYDRYEVNNSVRHVLPIEFIGLPKTLAMASFCRRLNPYCRTTIHDIFFGRTDPGGKSTLEQLEDAIDGADALVDTAGSHQIQVLLARVAMDFRIPFISSWLTSGFRGGHVVRTVSDQTRCFTCFARDLAEGQLHVADAGPDVGVIAQGCSHPTTAGAGFDASELAATCVRLTVQTLLERAGVARAEWDHAAVSFYRSHDDPEFPRFLTERLPLDKDCERCTHVGSSVLL